MEQKNIVETAYVVLSNENDGINSDEKIGV